MLSAQTGKPRNWLRMHDEFALDARSLDALEDWLAPFLQGATGFGALTSTLLRDALLSRVPYDLRAKLEDYAPVRFEAPTGSKVML